MVGRAAFLSLAMLLFAAVARADDGGLASDASVDAHGDAGNGTSCSSASECSSGFCASGVCCDMACDNAICTSTMAIAPNCSSGTCRYVATECAPFKCVAGRCKMGCDDDWDCPSGQRCVSGACEAPLCTHDGWTAVGFDGSKHSCMPYRCAAGVCLSECATNDDCAPGWICQPKQKVCAPANPVAYHDGSTECGYRARGTSSFGLVLVSLIWGARAARARSRASRGRADAQ